VADVDVNHFEGFVDGRSNLRAMESFIEDVAIEAPVTAEDDEDTFVGRGGGMQSFSDLLVGVGLGIVDVLVVERRAKASGRGMLGNENERLIAVLQPSLGKNQIFLMKSMALFQGQSDLQKEEMKPRVRHLAIGDFVGEIGEALGFPRSPKLEFVVERKRFAGGRVEAWRRLLGIEGG
jgi:hypothetical protein